MLATLTPLALPPQASSFRRMCSARLGKRACELGVASRLDVPPAALEQEVHDHAGRAVVGVVAAVAVAAAGVDEVGKIELVDALLLHQVEHRGQALHVALGDGEAQAHLEAALPAQAHAADRLVEGRPT
jgi:hypothetical protein